MKEPECKLCGELIADVPGEWCFGCKAFICENHWNSPWGAHEPKAHDGTGDEEEDDTDV